MNRKQRFLAAFKAALPICVGYLPLGFACGVALQNSGFTPFAIACMSILVYAGGGQFVAASMVGAGAGALALISTIFIVNIRHILLSWTLSPFLPKMSPGFLLRFAAEVTDESFAINYVRFREGDWDPGRAIVLNHIAHLTWIFSTALGGVAGALITVDVNLVNFVLTSMFICLLCMQIESKLFVAVGAFAAVASVLLKMLFGGSLYIIVTAVLAAAFGYWLEKRLELKGEVEAVE